MAEVILVTGANGNLGEAVCRKFLDSGYIVVAIDKMSGKLDVLLHHHSFSFYQADLLNEDEVHKLIEELIIKYTDISGALLLAGGFASGGIETTDLAGINHMINLNFSSVYNVARPVFRHMMNKGYGRMVFAGARPALEPSAGKNMIAYSLSKSLLFTFSQLLNADAKGKNVVSSVIVPSTIDTPENRKSMPNASFEKWVTPEAIAEILEFVCSHRSAPLRETVLKVYGDS